jgi:hypothetical protein
MAEPLYYHATNKEKGLDATQKKNKENGGQIK